MAERGAPEQTCARRTGRSGPGSSARLLSRAFAKQLVVCCPCLEHLPAAPGGLTQLEDEAEIVGTGGESVWLFCSPNC